MERTTPNQALQPTAGRCDAQLYFHENTVDVCESSLPPAVAELLLVRPKARCALEHPRQDSNLHLSVACFASHRERAFHYTTRAAAQSRVVTDRREIYHMIFQLPTSGFQCLSYDKAAEVDCGRMRGCRRAHARHEPRSSGAPASNQGDSSSHVVFQHDFRGHRFHQHDVIQQLLSFFDRHLLGQHRFVGRLRESLHHKPCLRSSRNPKVTSCQLGLTKRCSGNRWPFRRLVFT